MTTGLERIGKHLPTVTSSAESSPALESSSPIEAALAAFDSENPRPDEHEFAVLIKPLFDFAVAFGLPVDAKQVEPMTSVYREALAEVPADLLAIAVATVRRTWKWGNRMPLPADLLAAIDGDMREYFVHRSHCTDMARTQVALAELDGPRFIKTATAGI